MEGLVPVRSAHGACTVRPMTTPSPAPTTVGRYEILKELGRGVMGVVYEAHDPILHRSVALKTINVTFASSPAERDAFGERFLAEARIAARLAHPGIVVVHDVGRDEATGLLFISLERLPGERERIVVTVRKIGSGGVSRA